MKRKHDDIPLMGDGHANEMSVALKTPEMGGGGSVLLLGHLWMCQFYGLVYHFPPFWYKHGYSFWQFGTEMGQFSATLLYQLEVTS